jgi:diadenosine tetraphosphatase ApaH/serine/threonine PP2A family protein phosphatase
MKTAILTDLHANREAVQAVLAHAARQGVHRYALLGDFVGYGADPGWVVDRVRELAMAGALVVQGNHDAATVQGSLPGMRPEPALVIEWTRSRLSPMQLQFLAELPLVRDDEESLFVHANAWAPEEWDYVQSRDDAVRSLQATAKRITFCGHMHEPQLYHLSPTGKSGQFLPTPEVPIPLLAPRHWLVVPGSAGQPRDGNPCACYATYDDACSLLSYWRVPYDIAGAAAKIIAAGLPPALAERLRHGV